MADSDELLEMQKTLSDLKNGFKVLPSQLNVFEKAIDLFAKSVLRAKQNVNSYAQALQDDNKTLRGRIQNGKALNEAIRDEIASAKAQSKTSEEYAERIGKFKEQFVGLDQVTMNHINTMITGTEREKERQEKFARLLEGVKPVFASLSKAGSTILRDYQSGGSQISGSAAVLEGAVGAVGSAMSSAGKATSAAGAALSTIPGPAMAFGVALTGIGAIMSGVGRAAQEVAQKVLPFLSAELEKNIKAFQGISSTGAMFAGGLGDIINASTKAGLTVQQMDAALKNNRESLAGLGESLTGATRKLGSVFETGGKTFKKELLDMGFTIEEQTGLVAETMRGMRQYGGTLTASNPEIIAETKKYAENLRIVSNITGEDAKKKMEENRKQNQRLAIQQGLSNLTEKQRAGFERGQNVLSGLQNDAVRQMIAFQGQIADPELAATIAQSPALAASVKEAYASIMEGTFDTGQASEIQKKYGDQITTDLKNATGVAQAGMANVGGIVQGIEKRLGEELEFRNRLTPAALKKAEEEQKAAIEEAKRKESQTGKMTEVIMQQQELQVQIQKKILQSNVMSLYAQAVADATQAMLDMVDKLEGMITKKGGGVQEQIKDVVKQQQQAYQGEIAPDQVQNQIRLREQEIELLKSRPQRRGSNYNQLRTEVLQRQIEELKKQQGTATAKPAEAGTPAPSSELPAATPTTPKATAPGEPGTAIPAPVTPNAPLERRSSVETRVRLNQAAVDQATQIGLKAGTTLAVSRGVPIEKPLTNNATADAVAALEQAKTMSTTNNAVPVEVQQTLNELQISTKDASTSNDQLLKMVGQMVASIDTLGDYMRDVVSNTRTTADNTA